MAGSTLVVTSGEVARRIFKLRGAKVMLSSDLVQPLRRISERPQAVKRNLARFPDDFTLQLSLDEFDNLKSQIVTSRWGNASQCHLLLSKL